MALLCFYYRALHLWLTLAAALCAFHGSARHRLLRTTSRCDRGTNVSRELQHPNVVPFLQMLADLRRLKCVRYYCVSGVYIGDDRNDAMAVRLSLPTFQDR